MSENLLNCVASTIQLLVILLAVVAVVAQIAKLLQGKWCRYVSW